MKVFDFFLDALFWLQKLTASAVLVAGWIFWVMLSPFIFILNLLHKYLRELNVKRKQRRNSQRLS